MFTSFQSNFPRCRMDEAHGKYRVFGLQMIFDQRLKGGEEVSYVSIWKKIFPGRVNGIPESLKPNVFEE